MLIAACTSWPKRVSNLPRVIDSILANTCPPDKVVITLSLDEFPDKVLPKEVQDYIDQHSKVSVNWVNGNWKVYKKFLPILKDYPNDLIFTFDDDILYPDTVIEKLLVVHKQYPNSPITGANAIYKGIQSHCGCASLIQARFYAGWEDYVDESFVSKCASSDLFYTQLAAFNGYFYKPTHENMWLLSVTNQYNESNPYSNRTTVAKSLKEMVQTCSKFVCKHFPDGRKKPLCVLGTVDTPRGNRIASEMLKWLIPNFNVFEVKHNGKMFEYPALKFLQNLVVSGTYDEPIFYVHTKGAYHIRRESEAVKKMWRYEFVNRQKEYLAAVDGNEPLMAAPFAGYATEYNHYIEGEDITFPIQIPYENGWCANAAAIRQMSVKRSKNRYWYEMCMYPSIDIIGMRASSVGITDHAFRHQLIEDAIKTFKKYKFK